MSSERDDDAGGDTMPGDGTTPAADGVGAEGAPVSAPPGGLEERLATLEAEKKDLRERMLRIAAEFENWKKRSRKEQSDAEAKAREGVLREILEVVDNLERATLAGAMTSDPKAIQEGIVLVLRLFLSKLERWDVRALDAKGKPFDPRLHDAVSQAPSAHVPPGTVISEVVKGYHMGDRLLRPASVIVSAAPAAAGGGASNGSGSAAGGDGGDAAEAAGAGRVAGGGEGGGGGTTGPSGGDA